MKDHNHYHHQRTNSLSHFLMTRTGQTLLFLLSLSHLVTSDTSSSSANSNPNSIRFSRLLSSQPDILRFTSISNPNAVPSTRVDTLPFLRQPMYQSASVLEGPRGPGPSFHNPFPSDYFEDRLITKASSDERKGGPNEFVRIFQGVTSELITPQAPRSSTSSPPPPAAIESSSEGSLTGINGKPVTGRTSFSVSHEMSGNRLNFSPVFYETNGQLRAANFLANLRKNVTQEQREDDLSKDVVTISPNTLNEDEEEEVTTTSNPFDELEMEPLPKEEGPSVVSTTFSPPSSSSRVTLFDNTTWVPSTTPFPMSTSTATSSSESYEDGDEDENLLTDSFHRHSPTSHQHQHRSANIQFPDFEDTPTALATAASGSQAARVNVRPSSSGKDYEYEYIYYYYDDDEDEEGHNGTVTQDGPNASVGDKDALTPSTSTTAATPQPILTSKSELSKGKVIPTEKVPSSKFQKNLLEKLRGSKTFSNEGSSLQAQHRNTKKEDEEEGQETLPEDEEEPLEHVQEPSSTSTTTPRNRPIFIKMSNLTPSTTIVPPSSTPSSSSPEAASGRTVGQRLRGSHPRRPNPNIVQSTTPPDSKSQLSQELSVPVNNGQGQGQQEQGRLPGRTRFPPRASPTSTSGPVLDSFVTPPAPTEGLTVSPEDQRAKDNFARQKSVNDLYALSRLHQLAINTRVPTRKAEVLPNNNGYLPTGPPPKSIGGFKNSAEDYHTTTYPEEPLLHSETTTVASLFTPSGSFGTTPAVETSSPSSTTVSSGPSEGPDRFGVKGKNNRFRGRPRVPSPSPEQAHVSSTTESGSGGHSSTRPSGSNRFAGGRRRNFSPSGPTPSSSTSAATGNENIDHQPSSTPQTIRPRQPSKNRFSGRARPTSTSTTTEGAVGSPSTELADQDSSNRPGPGARRRPNNFQGRRRPQPTPVAPSSPAPQTDAGEGAAPAESVTPSTAEQGKRRPNVLAGRKRVGPSPGPSSGPSSVSPIVGRPLRPRTSTTTSTEAPEATATEAGNSGLVLEPETNQQVAAPEADNHSSQKVVVSSTTTVTESEEPPSKRGSMGVLGRIRARAKPQTASSTVAPTEANPLDKKPSRLNGILNRRKPGGVTSTSSTTEHPSPSPDDPAGHELEGHKGVVVQVSSIVTESESSSDHHDDLVEDQSSSSPTTQGSILSRLKSNRKPGALFKKKSE